MVLSLQLICLNFVHTNKIYYNKRLVNCFVLDDLEKTLFLRRKDKKSLFNNMCKKGDITALKILKRLQCYIPQTYKPLRIAYEHNQQDVIEFLVNECKFPRFIPEDATDFDCPYIISISFQIKQIY